MIELDLVKGGNKVIELGLSKNNKYKIQLFWDSKHDLDAHALGLTVNGKHRSLQGDAGRILSTYNTACVLVNNPSQNIKSGEEQPFMVEKGYLQHTGDVRSATAMNVTEPEEELVVDLPKVPNDVNEIAFIVSIHPPLTNTFSEVKNARLVIAEENGKELINAKLTEEFGESNLVHLASIVKEGNNWNFLASPSGIVGDFNTLLSAVG